MKLRLTLSKLRLSHGAVGALLLAAQLASAPLAQAQTQWGVQVQIPSMQVPPPQPPAYAPPPAPQAFTATQAVAPLPAPAPLPPTIEQILAQQHARIQWGLSAGLISRHELRYVQSLQAQIEQQRYWAYSDGWLTADEQEALYGALNHLSSRIETSLRYGQPVGYAPQHYPIAPLPLVIWNFSGWSRPPQAHPGHGHGHPAPPAGHGHTHAAPRPSAVPIPTAPSSAHGQPRPPYQAPPSPANPNLKPNFSANPLPYK